MTIIYLSAKRYVICRFLLGPVYYSDSNGIPKEASDCFASIPRKMVIPLGPLKTLCDIPLWFVPPLTSEPSYLPVDPNEFYQVSYTHEWNTSIMSIDIILFLFQTHMRISVRDVFRTLINMWDGAFCENN